MEDCARGEGILSCHVIRTNVVNIMNAYLFLIIDVTVVEEVVFLG